LDATGVPRLGSDAVTGAGSGAVTGAVMAPCLPLVAGAVTGATGTEMDAGV